MINQTIMFAFFIAMFAILFSGLIYAIKNLVSCRKKQTEPKQNVRDSVDYKKMIRIADVGKMIEICKEA